MLIVFAKPSVTLPILVGDSWQEGLVFGHFNFYFGYLTSSLFEGIVHKTEYVISKNRLCDAKAPKQFYDSINSSLWYQKLDLMISQIQFCGITKSQQFCDTSPNLISDFTFFFIQTQGFNSDTVWVDSLWKLSQILYESFTDSLQCLCARLKRSGNGNHGHIYVLLKNV